MLRATLLVGGSLWRHRPSRVGRFLQEIGKLWCKRYDRTSKNARCSVCESRAQGTHVIWSFWCHTACSYLTVGFRALPYVLPVSRHVHVPVLVYDHGRLRDRDPSALGHSKQEGYRFTCACKACCGLVFREFPHSLSYFHNYSFIHTRIIL